MKRLRYLWLMASVMALGLAFAQPGSQIVIGLQAEPTTLDVAQLSDYNSSRTAMGMYDGLVRFGDGSTDVEAGLAERWDVSDDGLTYTFYLRPGVTFHDGTPVNAEAVEFSFARQIDPNHPFHDTGEFPYAEFTLGNISQIEVLDEMTVRLTLDETFAPFLANLAMHAAAIVSPTAVMEHGRDFSEHPVGTGPYRFVSWRRGVEVVLERNPDYWRGSPQVEKLIFRPIVEDQARLAALEAGEVDLAVNLPPDDLPRLRANKNFTFAEQAGMHTWYVVFNVTKKPFDDARVRQAMAFAVDRQAIVDAILGGTGVLAKNFLPPVVWGYTEDVAEYSFDPERAKALLAEAGYPNGFDVEFWVPESGSGMQQSVAMGTVIQDYLSRVGVRVTIQQFEWGTYLDRVIVPVENADAVPAMFEMSWIGDNGDPDNFLYILLSGDQFPNAGFNLGYYSNEQVDDLLRRARTSLNETERLALYTEAQQLIMADMPVMPVDHETQTVVMRSNIHGFVPHPTGVFRFETVEVSGR
ncbi:MAG TPA: ABC transporter substrate-binding protein [Trueperaceae bacterium]|nr:ABC transporter substrate-binding protein [Trueperaceae bacterium]